MAPPTRTLSITYGTLSLPATGYDVRDAYHLEIGYAEVTFRARVFVFASDRATFLSREAALEATFSTPRQRLTIVNGVTTREDYDPAANTGFDAEAFCEKVGTPDDTGLSALWEVTVVLNRPATLAGQAGRTGSTGALDEGPSGRKQLRLDGTYTALGPNTSREQFDAAIDAYVATRLVEVGGGTWDTSVTTSGTNDTNTRCDFSIQLVEIIGTSSVFQLTELVDPQLEVAPEAEQPGDSSSTARRARRVAVIFSAAVDRTQVLGLSALKTLYQTKVRAALVNAARTATGSGLAALVNERPVYREASNQLQVSVLVHVYLSSLVLQEVEVSDDVPNVGLLLTPVWNDNPFARDIEPGPGQHLRRVRTVTVRTAGGGGVVGSTGARVVANPIIPTPGVVSLGIGGAGAGDGAEAEAQEGFIELGSLRAVRERVLTGIAPFTVPLRYQRLEQLFVRAERA